MSEKSAPDPTSRADKGTAKDAIARFQDLIAKHCGAAPASTGLVAALAVDPLEALSQSGVEVPKSLRSWLRRNRPVHDARTSKLIAELLRETRKLPLGMSIRIRPTDPDES